MLLCNEAFMHFCNSPAVLGRLHWRCNSIWEHSLGVELPLWFWAFQPLLFLLLFRNYLLERDWVVCGMMKHKSLWLVKFLGIFFGNSLFSPLKENSVLSFYRPYLLASFKRVIVINPTLKAVSFELWVCSAAGYDVGQCLEDWRRNKLLQPWYNRKGWSVKSAACTAFIITPIWRIDSWYSFSCLGSLPKK